MAELRNVDPTSLIPNPDNPRRTPAPPAMDEQLVASIKAIGVIQPPRVKEAGGQLVIIAGNRRVKAAVAAGLASIDVLLCDAEEAADAMRSVSENLIRASLNSVDIWRATQALEAQGWNEQGIADALALPPRTVRRLKLLAHLLPAMLDVMAAGQMPNEDQLRTIAAATREEQAQVWKKHKPKKGQGVLWHEIARALSKRRMPFAAAKFGDDLAKAYGVVWDEDLFAPAGEDSRTTTNVEGFLGAQQEWLQNNLPERGRLLPVDEYGRCELPKKAEAVYGKPARTDHVGHYIDTRSGEVKTVAFRLPETKAAARPGKGPRPAAADVAGSVPTRSRPEVTQKACAMIGDLRTDALHQALREATIEDGTLLGLLVLAFGGRNVSVHSGAAMGAAERAAICDSLTEGGVLTADLAAVRTAARSMLTSALSCRDNMTDSGPVARVAGDAIGADRYLPSMATEDFLSCLSKAALERAAVAEGVRVEARAKDTRARLIERFSNGVYVFPRARFQLTPEELAKAGEGRGAPAAAEENGTGEDPDLGPGDDDADTLVDDADDALARDEGDADDSALAAD